MRMTTIQAVALADRADRLFRRAALAWERGNNSGNDAALKLGENQCEKLRNQAEALLKPLGIVVDYPGLYPSFTVRGFAEHSTIAAISAALERKRVIAK
jgi:hypothetical protein